MKEMKEMKGMRNERNERNEGNERILRVSESRAMLASDMPSVSRIETKFQMKEMRNEI